jgi:hypothetical protein
MNNTGSNVRIDKLFALLALVIVAFASGCIGATETGGEGDFEEGDFLEEPTLLEDDENVGENAAPIRGGFLPDPCPSWRLDCA